MTKRSRRHQSRTTPAAPMSCAAIRCHFRNMLKPTLMQIAYPSPEAAGMMCRRLLQAPLLILDVEANGARHASEIVEIGLMDEKGSVVYHSLVQANQASTPHAFAVHGIPQSALRDAPTFEEIWPKVRDLLLSRPVISFDIRSDLAFLTQTLARHGIVEPRLAELKLQCAMLLYRAYRQSPQCIGLKQACEEIGIDANQRHRVIDDCRMTLGLLESMAKGRVVAPIASLNPAAGSLGDC